MQQDYWIYQHCLWEIPEFLYKYINLDIVQRLKNISFLCGMDYASDDIYNFSCKISRFDHSVNVARITWHFTKDRKATIAALFHDISTPVFSHVIDVLNGDSLKQESTEEKTYEILKSSKHLKTLLEEDRLTLDEVSDFKRYTIVDLDRPKLCADRLDGTLSSAMAWANIVDARCCEQILNSLLVEKNEDGEEELSFDNSYAARYFKIANDTINRLTHSSSDNYMMNLLANIVKRCLNLNIFTYDELYIMDEPTVIELIEDNIQYDIELESMWLEFKTIEQVPNIKKMQVKEKDINPLILGRRLV